MSSPDRPGAQVAELSSIMVQLAVVAAAVQGEVDRDGLSLPALAGGLLEFRDLARDASALLSSDLSEPATMLRLIAETTVLQAEQAMQVLTDSMAKRKTPGEAGQAAAWPLGYAEMLSGLYRRLGYGGDDEERAH